MKSIVEVEYQIIDRGVYFAPSKRELIIKPNGSIGFELNKAIKKDSRPMGLSTKWRVEIRNSINVGWVQ